MNKNNIRKLTATITAIAATISIAIAFLPNPNETQQNLANTSNTIAIAGTAALFGLVDDEEESDKEE
ncbi:MAG: hypothetical protein AAGA60_26125 [Cyanobacteria bacterium P01_E01_bin.42]